MTRSTLAELALLITGACEGIGRGIALAVADAGARVLYVLTRWAAVSVQLA